MKKLASLFLIFATVLMLSACSASKPEDVAKEFVEASYKGDADKMLSLIHFLYTWFGFFFLWKMD